MKMVEVKTSELEGAVLDWAVAKAEGWDFSKEFYRIMVQGYCPSTDWSQGGPLIEKHEIGIERLAAGWFAVVAGSNHDQYSDAPPLVVAMRALVAAKLGDTVQVPADLIGGAA